MALSVSVWLDSSESGVLRCCGIFCLLFRKCPSIQNIYANEKTSVMKRQVIYISHIVAYFSTCCHVRNGDYLVNRNTWNRTVGYNVCNQSHSFHFLFRLFCVCSERISILSQRCVFSSEALAACLFQGTVWKHRSFCLISEYFHKNAYLKSCELMGKVWLNSDQVGMLRQTWREGDFIRHLPL